jgi:hypothetical protein
LWAAAGLTFYTGYAYLQAGLHHARRVTPPHAAASVGANHREPRTA